MLDPLTSLSLAVNIIQLVDFGLTTCATVNELAKTGTTTQYEDLENLLQANLRLCEELSQDADSEGQGDLHSLAVSAQDTSQELTLLLNDLSLRDTEAHPDVERPTKRRRTIAGRCLKGLWKQKDVQKLEDRLKSLQQQIMLNISVHQNSSTSAMLRSLKGIEHILQQERVERIASYEKLVKMIKARSEEGASSRDEQHIARTFNHNLEKLADQARTITKCQKVLKTLAFEEMYNRAQDIPKAHAHTFQWIFSDRSVNFEAWASGKSGMFWITGKPGSGKSTLMKFLASHPHTTTLLRKWAGDDDLIVADYYFWNAGSSLQKSRMGLLRTLLAHIILQCPELAIQCLPGRFRDAKASHFALRWTQVELTETIRAVATQKNQGVRLCLFVDGLDENPEEHIDLVELLRVLGDNPTIKICLSSRPWNVFTRAYHHRTDGQLAVQDLTSYDIQTYVNDEMSKSFYAQDIYAQDPERWKQLVQLIVLRAEGVFLWVYLVVRSLIRGIGNDDDLEILMKRIEQYPKSLDEYFQRMFDRIEDVYLEQSARILLAANSAEGSLPLWAPRCIEKESGSPDYALKLRARNPTKRVLGESVDTELFNMTGNHCAGWLMFSVDCPSLTDDSTLHHCSDPWDQMKVSDTLNRYVDARCADLLEVKPTGITFIHRTARDFLRQRELPAILYERAGRDYDVALSLGRLYLAGSKRTGEGSLLRLRTLVDAIKPANLEAYAELFRDLEKQFGTIQIILPPVVQRLKMKAEMQDIYQPFVAPETDDVEILFGQRLSGVGPFEDLMS